jgi:hypothetical protein
MIAPGVHRTADNRVFNATLVVYEKPPRDRRHLSGCPAGIPANGQIFRSVKKLGDSAGFLQAAEAVGQVAEAVPGRGVAGLRIGPGLGGPVEVAAGHPVELRGGDQPQGRLDAFFQ